MIEGGLIPKLGKSIPDLYIGDYLLSRKYFEELKESLNMNWKGGITKMSEYYIWRDILRRCCDPRRPEYPRYGGRGITICARWLDSFWNFYEDMGKRPVKMCIERIDNGKGYSPENCKWGTRSEQSMNKRAYSNTGLKHIYYRDNKFIVKFNKSARASRQTHVGTYLTIEEATIGRDEFLEEIVCQT